MDKFVVDLDRILDDLEAQECESMPSPQLKYVPCTGEPLADGGHTRPGHSDHEIGTVRHQESDGFSNGCCSSPDTMSHSPNAEPSGTLMSCKSPARVADPAHHCETPIPFTSCLTSVCSPSSSAHPKSITNGAGDLIPVKSERETVVPAEKTHLRMSPGSSDTAESTSDSPTQVVAISSIAAHVISPVDRGTVSDDVHDGAQSFQGTAANGSDNIEDDEEILAKVMKDVEEYEKSRGPDGNAGPHEYEDEELNRIIRSIDDWGKLSGKIALDQADEDFEDENEYDEDLAKLTNGLLSHTSSLKPGKEISHKAFAPESRDAALADSTSSSLHINSSEDHAEPSQCLRFADCRVDSDDLSEEQMNAYLRDVRSSPQAPPSPVSGPSEDHGTPSQPIDGQTRAVRPNSLDLDLMNEPLMLDTTEVLHTAVPDESLPRDGPPSDPMHEEGIRVGHHRSVAFRIGIL